MEDSVFIDRLRAALYRAAELDYIAEMMASFKTGLMRNTGSIPPDGVNGYATVSEFVKTGEYTLMYTRQNEPAESMRIKLTIIDDGTKTPPEAHPTESAIILDGTAVSLTAFNINDSNYVRLRDFAEAVSGTVKQFDIERDDKTKTSTLITGEPFTPGEIYFTIKPEDANSILPSSVNVSVGGENLTFNAYSIGGLNFVKLRDIGKALDCNVSWNGAGNTIIISTTESYTAD